MKIYLVNPSSRPYTIEANPMINLLAPPERMIIPKEVNNENLYCRRTSGKERNDSPRSDDRGGQGLMTIPNQPEVYDINILESFYYAKDNKVIERLLPYIGNFLLDSGAFTFMNNSHLAKIDWDAYTEDYADYINRHNIKLFFELDIDNIVGLSEVERLRQKLQALTGKPPIPVWHISRGKDYFEKMCKNYPYVSIGGIVTQEIPRDKYERLFPWFIRTAHAAGAKIHGLGYTGKLKQFRFDSVDSTAWLYGNRGGYLYRFDARTGNMTKIDAPAGKRLKSSDAALYNFNEWLKYADWAKINL